MKFNTNLKENILNKICVLWFLILIKGITTIGYHLNDETQQHHHLTKRMDLESCLGQFDIHHNTIIRTEESQAIGGKFVQGIPLNNLEECQRLCCETNHCDVYIFEEKAEGYCYLFECGPPENFHCKFTRHTNYTSAVFTPIKHPTLPPTTVKPIILPQPQVPPPTPSLSQHEIELTNLKQKSELNIIQQDKIRSTSNPLVAVGGFAIEDNIDSGNKGRIVNNGVRTTEQITTPKNTQVNVSVCGRFQFQCHSGECIAVYNACDGIPQCEDGSDEGAECPSTTGIESKSINAETSNLGDLINYRIPSVNAAVPLSKQIVQQTLHKSYQQQPQQTIQTSIINNREDPLSAPAIWPSRKDTQNIDIERNSRIFNHKGGLQLSVNSIGPQYQNSAPNIYTPLQRDMYLQGDIQNGYIQPQANLNWQQTQIQQQQLPPGPYVISVNGQPVPQVKSVPIISSSSSQLDNTQIRPKTIKLNNNNNNNSKKTDVVVPTESNLLNEKTAVADMHKNHLKNKVSAEESEDYSYYEEKSTEPPKKKQRKHKKISSKDKNKAKKEREHEINHEEMNGIEDKPSVDALVHERYKMIKEDLEMEFVDHDGQSERPGGAVLSLTLGLIVTAALAILIGCRMRTVSRRIRRIGKAPYAHDADFLVNGMYLK